MSEIVVAYDLAGSHVEVTAPRAPLLGWLDSMLGDLKTPPAAAPVFRIRIDEGTPEPMPSPVEILSVELDPAGRTCQIAQSGGTFLMTVEGELFLDIRPREQTARLVVAPGAESIMVGVATWRALEAAIDASGQVVLHAAGLTLPDDGRAILIHAPSGTGKTTVALALARSGLGLWSDDAMVLTQGPAGMAAWGLPRDLNVHRQTLAMLPWLAPTIDGRWSAEGECLVKRRALEGLAALAEGRPAAVAASFHLRRSSDGETRVRAMPRADALIALATDNVRVSSKALLPIEQKRYTTLARLVAGVPVFEISAGRDLSGLGEAVMRAVGSAAQPGGGQARAAGIS